MHLCRLGCSQDKLQPYVFCVGDAQLEEYDDEDSQLYYQQSDVLHPNNGEAFTDDGDNGEEEVDGDRWDSHFIHS